MFAKQRFIYNKSEKLLYNESGLKLDVNMAMISYRRYHKKIDNNDRDGLWEEDLLKGKRKSDYLVDKT